MSNTFRPFKRKESKRAFEERVHAEVVKGETIQQLWRVYYDNRFARVADRPLEPEHIELLREVFYAGIATMFHLMTKFAGPEEEPDEEGAARIQRLYEELETYAERKD